jgi:hypothetical protein
LPDFAAVPQQGLGHLLEIWPLADRVLKKKKVRRDTHGPHGGDQAGTAHEQPKLRLRYAVQLDAEGRRRKGTPIEDLTCQPAGAAEPGAHKRHAVPESQEALAAHGACRSLLCAAWRQRVVDPPAPDGVCCSGTLAEGDVR